MADKELQNIAASLKRSFIAKDYRTIASHLTAAKIALLQRNALIPNPATPKAILPLARDILEIAALASIHLNDESAFGRYYAQLQPFYDDDQNISPPSSNKSKLIGLHLLLLLSNNDIAEFHTALETLVGVAEDDVFIQYPVMLERWLMEGSYDKVWNATKSTQVPSEEYSLFTKILVNTIRNEIAMCSEKAYPSIPVVNGINLFFLDSERAVVEFAREKGWDIRDGRIYFPEESESKGVLQAGAIIENTVLYAKELETIV